MAKPSPFDPLYGLKLDAMTSAFLAINASAFGISCRSDRCQLVLSRLNDAIPFDRYYLAVIDREGSLRDALLLNLLILSGFCAAAILFVARLTAELVHRRTRVAGDDRAILLLIGGVASATFAFGFDPVDGHGHTDAKHLFLVTQAAAAASSFLERGLIQFLARSWDKATLQPP